MSTISKISIGGKDYDIGQSGLGTQLSSSDNLDNITTPDTRYYYDGGDTAPTNSPITLAYTLEVRSSPNSSADVIQIIESIGSIIEREHATGGSWGDWRYVTRSESDVFDLGNGTHLKVSNGVATLLIAASLVTGSNNSITSMPAKYAPKYTDRAFVFSGTLVYSENTSDGGSYANYVPATFSISPAGAVNVYGLDSAVTTQNKQAFACITYAI